jgi:class 3 adenylate cyclase
MTPQGSLFRQEAIEFQQHHRQWGEVALLQPLSTKILTRFITAVEDAPLRACRAALGILQRLKAAGPDLEAKHSVRPQLRIGLNTVPAVVGQVEGGADAGVTVLGDTVNFASRLQSLVEPDSVFMSGATHRLVDATFTGEHTIKGKSETQKVYRLDGIRHGATRFDANRLGDSRSKAYALASEIFVSSVVAHPPG